MGKRLLSTLLVLCMVLTIFPSTAFASDSDFVIENGVLVKYTGAGGNVIIPDSVTKIGNDAFSNCTKLVSITIPSSVTEIGTFAFQNCTNLTSVSMGNGVASIGMYAFSFCTSLLQVNIPDSVTVIGECVFCTCTSLTKITIPSSVTYIDDGAFLECSSLTEVTIPQSVTYIGTYAFAECTSLTNIVIPKKITIASDAFHETTIEVATYLDGSALSTAEIYRLFPGTPLSKQSQGQSSVTISTEGFTVRNGILTKYYGAGGNVIIPDGITVIGDEAFLNCNNLTSVVIPDSVTHIGNWSFAKCRNLLSVTIPDSITTIGDCAFSECTNLSELTLPDSVTSIGDLAFICTNIASIALPSEIDQFGQYLFQDCKALASVTFPKEGKTAETLKNWSIGDFDDLFVGCSSLSVQSIENIPCEAYNQQLSLIGWLNPGSCITPQSERIVSLANKIIAGLDSNYEKAYAICEWVSHNIDYGDGHYDSKQPENVLDSGIALCEGYSRLTEALLDAVNIPSLCVPGRAGNRSHMWNYIFVDDHWIWADTTWGMDYFDSSLYLLRDHVITALLFESDYHTPSDWAQSEVWDAIITGLVPNDLQSAYRNNITREEFCRLMVTLMEQSVNIDIDAYLKAENITVSNPFIDTDDSDVLAAYALGIVSGTSENTFSPGNSITRQEAATMLARTAKVLDLTTEESENFKDAGQFASWASESIAFVSGLADPTNGVKVMNGMGNGNFAPTDSYSREQAILTALRLFHCTA